MQKSFKFLLIFVFSISLMGLSQQNVFAEDDLDDSIEFRMSEQAKLAEKILDDIFLTSGNPYDEIQTKTLSETINSNVNYVEIENFKTNNIKLEQSNLAEITMFEILGYKQIHQETKINVDPIIQLDDESDVNSNQHYLQNHISNMEKIRDDVLFAPLTTISNPYEKDLKTIQEDMRIIEQNMVKIESDIYDDVQLKQENLAQITMFEILGYKQIHNPTFDVMSNSENEFTTHKMSGVYDTVARTDDSFEIYKSKQIESSENFRNQLFEIYHSSNNPYLEYGTNLDTVVEIVQTVTDGTFDTLERDDPIFELKKLLESDKAEELRLKLNGKIYDETFEDDYLEIIDD